MADISIVDYSMGNMGSIRGALEHLGVPHRLVRTPEEVGLAGKLILPGVGSFGRAMRIIGERGLGLALRDAALVRRVPLLGICLGMQLLAEAGEEGGPSPGLGLIRGLVTRLDPGPGGALKVPHMGFNGVRPVAGSRLFAGFATEEDFYFAHSYYLRCDEDRDIAALTTYGAPFPAAVERDNVWGCQFHPEKSQGNGLRLLRNFAAA